ncbi:MAG: Mov34/MPN/PAD-1 family protein [Aridibacter sp.]
MKFLRENGGVVSFNKDAVKTLLDYRQVNITDKEAGGMLLGRLISYCDDIVIDEVTTPSSDDEQHRFSFFRKKNLAQKIVEEKWQNSEGTQIYLGEWHTHPEEDPTPSASVDINNWCKIIQNAVYEQEMLFFVIVGTRKTRIWEINKNTKNMSKLETICFEGS